MSRSRLMDVPQRQCGKGPRGVLRQAAIAHLDETPQLLDHREDVLDPGAYPGLVTVLRAPGLVDFATAVAHTLVGKVLRVRRLARDEFLLAGIGAVTVHTPLGDAACRLKQFHSDAHRTVWLCRTDGRTPRNSPFGTIGLLS